MLHFSNKYIQSLIALIAIAVFLQGCTSPDKTESDKRIFRLNIASGTVESIDPAFAKNLYNMWADHMVYNTLVETDEHLHLVPSLATHWDVSADGLIYLFYIRNDVFFQDAPEFTNGKGRRMTATDVVYSFNRIIDPATASSGSWIFNDRVAEKEPFTVINDTTIQIKLRAPFRPLTEILTMPYCSIVPKEVAEHWGKDFARHPCGTGPFQLHYWDESNTMVLHKNPHYWEKDSTGIQLPYTEAVQISFTDSKATEFFLFLQGKLDFVNGIDGSFKDLVLNKDGSVKKEYATKLQLQKGTYLNTEYIGFLLDTNNAIMAGMPTRNMLVRQAINYAIDKKKIVMYFRNGIGQAASSGFIPAGMPGYDSTHSFGYSYDPKRSLELLEKAGYPNGKGLGTFTILCPDNWSDAVNFIVTELQDVGIKAKVEIIQRNIELQQMSRSQAVAFRSQWIADYPDAETFLSFFNGRFPAPPNYTRYNNATYNKWYDESMNAPDTLRWQLYRRMDSLVTSQAPLIPLFYDEMLHFLQPNISGFRSNPMNLIDLKRVRKN